MRLGNYYLQVLRLFKLAQFSLKLKSGKRVDLAREQNVLGKALAA